MNRQPMAYESTALPLSYFAKAHLITCDILLCVLKIVNCFTLRACAAHSQRASLYGKQRLLALEYTSGPGEIPTFVIENCWERQGEIPKKRTLQARPLVLPCFAPGETLAGTYCLLPLGCFAVKLSRSFLIMYQPAEYGSPTPSGR